MDYLDTSGGFLLRINNATSHANPNVTRIPRANAAISPILSQ